MKCYRWETYGDLAALSASTAERKAPGPKDIVMKVRANSLNHRDLMVCHGIYKNLMSTNQVPGLTSVSDALIPVSDSAGEVVEIGSDVTRFKVGDKVVPTFRQGWISGDLTIEGVRGDLGGAIHGTLQEYVTLHEDGYVRMPEHLSFEEAACLPVAGLTAWKSVITKGQASIGETVLLEGSGGVSMFALAFAKQAGARVIVTTSKDEKIARLKAHGADAVVNYAKNPDWHKQVLDLTQGRGVDLTVDVGGPSTMAKSIEATRMGGRVILMGLLGGFDDQSPFYMNLFIRDITARAAHPGTRNDLEIMNCAMEQGHLRPVIDRQFTFDQAREAFLYFASAQHVGKVVITHSA